MVDGEGGLDIHGVEAALVRVRGKGELGCTAGLEAAAVYGEFGGAAGADCGRFDGCNRSKGYAGDGDAVGGTGDGKAGGVEALKIVDVGAECDGDIDREDVVGGEGRGDGDTVKGDLRDLGWSDAAEDGLALGGAEVKAFVGGDFKVAGGELFEDVAAAFGDECLDGVAWSMNGWSAMPSAMRAFAASSRKRSNSVGGPAVPHEVRQGPLTSWERHCS